MCLAVKGVVVVHCGLFELTRPCERPCVVCLESHREGSAASSGCADRSLSQQRAVLEAAIQHQYFLLRTQTGEMVQPYHNELRGSKGHVKWPFLMIFCTNGTFGMLRCVCLGLENGGLGSAPLG